MIIRGSDPARHDNVNRSRTGSGYSGRLRGDGYLFGGMAVADGAVPLTARTLPAATRTGQELMVWAGTSPAGSSMNGTCWSAGGVVDHVFLAFAIVEVLPGRRDWFTMRSRGMSVPTWRR